MPHALVQLGASHFGTPHRRAISVYVPDMTGLSDEDKILKFWRERTAQLKPTLPDLSEHTLTNVCSGVGDTVILTDLPRSGAEQGKIVSVYSNSVHFDPIMSFNPHYRRSMTVKLVDAPSLMARHNCGNGHFIQRLQRAFGLQPSVRPHGCIVCERPKVKNRVILHFEAGAHASWQVRHVHPRARQLYPENCKAIEKLIKSNPGWEFVEIGRNPIGIEGARTAKDLDLRGVIELMATAEWFIGIISGPMHIAAALGLRSVVIVNFPDANLIFLPTLRDTGQIEEEWFYPMNVHLHQDMEGPLVPKFSLGTLKKALDGSVYPYWSDKFLPLVFQEL